MALRGNELVVAPLLASLVSVLLAIDLFNAICDLTYATGQDPAANLNATNQILMTLRYGH